MLMASTCAHTCMDIHTQHTYKNHHGTLNTYILPNVKPRKIKSEGRKKQERCFPVFYCAVQLKSHCLRTVVLNLWLSTLLELNDPFTVVT